MSPVREKFVKVIEALPYELEEEIKKKPTIDILKEVTEKYVETYGTEDLTEEDKECINNILCKNFNPEKEDRRKESE